jgi:membrane protein
MAEQQPLNTPGHPVLRVATRDHALGQTARAGCDAEGPTGISGQGWWAILARVRQALARDHIWLAAEATTFCSLFAAIPGIAVLVSLYALLVSPAAIRHQLEMTSGLLPAQASHFLADQLQAIASAPQLRLGAGLGGAALAALWSAQAGAAALIAACNYAYR